MRGSPERFSGRESCYTRGINDFMPAHILHLAESALAQVLKGL
jgi:hypothetical protein